MGTPFWKMHGAGNDFILIDDRHLNFPKHSPETIATICGRRTGIGSEGLILIQQSKTADFRMRFFNPDGSEADMCGNGARCVARLAHDLNIAAAEMTIETQAGTLTATVRGASVQLHMPPPTGCRGKQSITLPSGEQVEYDAVATGVPHVVLLTKSIEAYPVVAVGRDIRQHDAFAPEGTNANFVEILGESEIRVRTYERGVEDETLACGTGIAAAAIAAALYHGVRPPVSARAQSGDMLTIDFHANSKTAVKLKLTGPAVYVFHGEIDDLSTPAEHPHA